MKPAPAVVLTVAAVLVAAAAPGLRKLELDSSPEVFFVRDAERLEEYRRLRGSFGSLETIRVLVRGPDLFSAGGLVYLAALEEEAAGVAGVRATAGPHSRWTWRSSRWPPDEPEELRRLVREDPLSRGAGWMREDGAYAAIDLWLEPGERSVPQGLEERLAEVPAPPGFAIDLVGLPIVERAFDDSLRRLLRRNLPVLVLLVTALLLSRLGSPRHALGPLLFVTAVTAAFLGALGHLGQRLNLVNAVVVPLLFVISAATAVHLQSAYLRRRRAGEEAGRAVASTWRRSGPAVGWATLTTAIAFGSFAASPLPPIRTLGIWLAIGSLAVLVAAWLLYPALLAAISARGRVEGGPGRRPERAAGWAAAALARPAATKALFGVTAVALLAGAARIEQQTGLASYFATSHPVRRAIDRAETAGFGVVTAELVLRLDPSGDGSFRDPRRLADLARLGRRLRELPEVRGAVGAGELFAAGLAETIVEGEATPAARWLVLGLLQGGAGTARWLDAYLGDEGRAARVALSLPLGDHRRLLPVLEAARAEAARLFPDARAEVTGELPMILAVQERLLATLAGSLALTAALVAVLLGVALRSARRAARVFAANLWPLTAVFGAMGWLGIPLDSTTVLSAAVVLGLSLDDSFHTLAEIGSRGRGPGAAVAAAARAIAPAHLTTSLVLTAGFAVCAVSDLAQNARFAALVAIGCVAALAADVALLPALLAGDDGPGGGGAPAGVSREKRA